MRLFGNTNTQSIVTGYTMFTKHNSTAGSITTIFLAILLVLCVGSGLVAYVLFFEGDKPQITLDDTSDFLGSKSTINYKATDKGSGLHTITITAVQGTLNYEIYSQVSPRTKYTGVIGPLDQQQKVEFNPVKAGFKEGEIEITAEVTDFSARNFLKGNTVSISKKTQLDTKAPHLRILHTEQYISPGGTGIAIYDMDDPMANHGITVNGNFYKGFPIGDGRETVYICYFPLTYDTERIDSLSLTAEDKAGNTATSSFSTHFKAVAKNSDKIYISDGFLNSKVPEFQQFYADLEGTIVEKYLTINTKIRNENNEAISTLCANPTPDRLWKGAFDRMPGSPRAGYADYRDYYYNDQVIDHQVHLGMDIASTQRAHVKAANNGIVLFGDYLGIYGNMILIDHGQGIYSLYSHLSQIDVQPGQSVSKGDIIGFTGTTGMAGGDHLHFSMLVQGVFVTPKEWWDAHWIESTIDGPILDSKL